MRVWDAGTGQLLHDLRGDTGGVWSVAWSPDGTRLLTGGGGVRVWDAGTGQLLHDLRGDTGAVRSVAWSPDGTRLVSGGDDGGVRVWDAGTGQLLHDLRGDTGMVRSVAWSPDGTRLLTGGGGGCGCGMRAPGSCCMTCAGTPAWWCRWRGPRTGPACSPAATTDPLGCGRPRPVSPPTA